MMIDAYQERIHSLALIGYDIITPLTADNSFFFFKAKEVVLYAGKPFT